MIETLRVRRVVGIMRRDPRKHILKMLAFQQIAILKRLATKKDGG